MGRPDKAQRAAIARRRSDAIDLRLAGVDWLTIARKLAADPAVNSDGVAYPQGYCIDRYRKEQDPPSDEALIHAAGRDVRQALADRRAELNDDVDELRALEADRLDPLFFVAYRKATGLLLAHLLTDGMQHHEGSAWSQAETPPRRALP